MIGLFDSGHGGLTVYRELVDRFPDVSFVYLGDHANAPYGNRSSDDVVDLTRRNVDALFDHGCRLVILACNTATAVACRTLQQDWLPTRRKDGQNILGIIAPTVEAATQTPWAITTPQYPQKFNTDRIAVFGTQRTVDTNVYREEILKRCPRAEIFQVACPGLAGAIERSAPPDEIRSMIADSVQELTSHMGGQPPDRVILGCTHFPLVKDVFAELLPAGTRLLSQPQIVADSLSDYLGRHPQYIEPVDDKTSQLFTTGDAHLVSDMLVTTWNVPAQFEVFGAR